MENKVAGQPSERGEQRRVRGVWDKPGRGGGRGEGGAREPGGMSGGKAPRPGQGGTGNDSEKD